MRKVLVTGATGYIGGRLVPRLLDRGDMVRVLVRDPGRVEGRAWEDRVEVAVGDVLDAASLTKALQGIDTAYYMIHAMGGDGDFADRAFDRVSGVSGSGEALGSDLRTEFGGAPLTELLG